MTFRLGFVAAVIVAQIVSASSSTQTLDPNVVKSANFAIEFHNRMTNCAYAYKVVEILSYSAQLDCTDAENEVILSFELSGMRHEFEEKDKKTLI
ncbi:uncharacterized protein zgc:194981 [Tachysurus ichikawai]